jgi:hypothetical protein
VGSAPKASASFSPSKSLWDRDGLGRSTGIADGEDHIDQPEDNADRGGSLFSDIPIGNRL